MIQFTIYGEPVAQGRPRASTISGHVRMYDPAKSRSYKEYVKYVAQDHRPPTPLTEALVLTVTIYRSMPKSLSKKKQAEALAGRIRPTTKPDCDNYLKTIKDALNGVIWKDDSQVVDVTVRKFYGDVPRVEILITEFETSSPVSTQESLAI